MGDVKGAVTIFRRALELEPTLDLDPHAEARFFAAEGLVTKGKNLAELDDVEGAIAQFQKALELNPTLDLDPETEARKLAAEALLKEGSLLAREGKVKEAIVAYKQAQTLIDPTLLQINADSWNTLGYHGSLSGYAADVMFACEKAVELAPDDGGIRHTRGLARALIGEYTGAIEDFQFYIKWGQGKHSEEHLRKRQDWIRELEADRNPFDEATLEALRNE